MRPDADEKRHKKLIVIGNGMAGIRVLEELLVRAPDAYDITVFGAEPRVNYNRLMLSAVLAGEKSFDDIVLNDADWYKNNNIPLHTGDPVLSIDRDNRLVTSTMGETLCYDRLLLATGSEPVMIPLPGHKLNGVIGFRDLDDVDRMLAESKTGGAAVVIGGGLLGLEAANGLAKRGMDVTVLHLAGHVMERQLDPPAARLLEKELQGRNIKILTQADTAEILGANRVEGVRLKDGTEIAAKLVVMAAGIRPSTVLAARAGLEVQRGILVDDFMTTSDPAIFALGECVQHRGVCYGLAAPIWDMAKTCADRLAGLEGGAYEGSLCAAKLKVTGVDLYSAGDFQGGDGTEDLVFRDPARGIYKRLVVAGSKLIGAVMYGETSDGPWYFDMIKRGEDICEIRDTLIFGQNVSAGPQILASGNP